MTPLGAAGRAARFAGDRRRRDRRRNFAGGGAARAARGARRARRLCLGHVEPLVEARARRPALSRRGPDRARARVGARARAFAALRAGAGRTDAVPDAALSGSKPGRRALGAGLAAYDLLAGRRTHRYVDRAEALRLAPPIASDGLEGAHVYEDATTDDARLVLRLIADACDAGGRTQLCRSRRTAALRQPRRRRRRARNRGRRANGGRERTRRHQCYRRVRRRRASARRRRAAAAPVARQSSAVLRRAAAARDGRSVRAPARPAAPCSRIPGRA